MPTNIPINNVAPIRSLRTATRGVIPQPITGTLEPLLSVRLAPGVGTYQQPQFLSVSVASSTNANFEIQVLANPIITGGPAPVWTLPSPDSILEQDIAQTGAATFGPTTILAYSFYVANNADNITLILPENFDPIDSADIVSVCGHTVSGSGTENLFASLTWLQ